MDTVMRSMVEAAAYHVLQEYRQTHTAWLDDKTPVDDIATWLGLTVATFHAQDYAEGTYGFIDADDDENLIWLRRDLIENFRRFTLAHEIAHALLHCHEGQRLIQRSPEFTELVRLQNELPEPSRTDPCHETDVQEDLAEYLEQEQLEETLGIGHAYDPRSQRELAANLFAAELLVPSRRLRALYLEDQVPAHTLATIFGVSQPALLNRLVSLVTEPVKPETQPAAAFQGPVYLPAKKRYDEFQQAAIEADTPALVVAGPGSGKTSTLIGRVEYLINSANIPPQRILALTFSRKATLEMEERLNQVLLTGAYALPKVSTFHAFCADLLRQHGALVGLRPEFTLIDEAEGYFILRQQIDKLHLRQLQKLQSPDYFFPDILKAISRAKDELVSPAEYAQLAQNTIAQAKDEEALVKAGRAVETAQVYALYEQELLRRGETDFGGLLVLAIKLLREHPEVLQEQQQKYAHILVDEFQDVNRASSILLRVLAGEARRVWVVGDANQAIYGFRGASPANISQFEHDFPGARVLPLSRNYRSRPDLVAIAESFRCRQLELGEEPGKNQPVRITQNDACVTIAQAIDEAQELTGLVRDIQYKHQQGYDYKDMIVLCRTRAHVQKISRVLATHGLPVIERGGMLEQGYIKDVLAFLLLIVDPSGSGILRVARQSAHTLSQADIEALLLAAREPQTTARTLIATGEAPLTMSVEGRRALMRISDILQALLRTNNMWSLVAQYLFIESSLMRDQLRLPEEEQDLARLGDYVRLLQLARHFDQQQKIRSGTVHTSAEANTPSEEKLSLEEQVKGFLEYLRLLVILRQDTASQQDKEEAGEEQADIIRIMTVHASKGLEFPVVYMPGLVNLRFPGIRKSQNIPPPQGMISEESSQANSHEVSESCLFYVGVTRAREHVILSYSDRYGKKNYKRSPYLDALEAGLSTERITKLQWEFPSEETVALMEADITPNIPYSSQPSSDFINAMRSPSLSSAAVELYQRCPRKYAYNHIYRFADETNTYQLFWKATQQTIEAVTHQLQEAQSDQLPTKQELKELYNKHWQELGGHTAPFAKFYEEHGHEVIDILQKRLHTQLSTNWQLRPAYNVDVGGQTVHVTIDRVENAREAQQPTKFVRTRYGKSKEKPKAETRELLYALAYRQQYPGQQVEIHQHNLSTGEIQPIKMTSKKETSLYEDMKVAIDGLEKQEYPAAPADVNRCPQCPFFFVCPG